MIADLTDDQHSLAAALREFCTKTAGTPEQMRSMTAPEHRGHHGPTYAKLAELGYIGAAVPEAYGGGGGGAVEMCVLIEEVNRGLLPICGLGVSTIVVGPYVRFGTEDQKQSILGGICSGRVEAIAMSEPGAGSDVAALTTRAEKTADGYVLNGQKMWTTAAHVADHLLVVCRTDPKAESKHKGLSMISVPTDTVGLSIRPIETMGGSEVNEVFFSDVVVSTGNLLGEQDNGWNQLMAGLNHERLLVAAQGLGRAQRALDDVVAYVKQRRQFGHAIAEFQTVRHRIADMTAEVEMLRHFVYALAKRVDENPGKLFPREASIAKLKGAEIANTAAIEAMRMMGGAGYAVEYGMERQVRDSFSMTIGGGVAEIQRDIIAGTVAL